MKFVKFSGRSFGAAFLMLSACSAGESNPSGSGGTPGTGGAVSSTGGAPGSGGVTATGGKVSTGGTTATGGMISSTGGAGTGGSGGGAGRAPATGGHGGSAVATGGAGGAPAGGGCTRELLQSTVDAYFKALAAHSAATLPLADTVKFTENSKVMKVGMEGLWLTAGALKFAHSALDTEGCNTATEAVVPDGTTDLPFALRLKLQDQKITEIETIAVRKGDYSALSSNTSAISMTTMAEKWDDPVPVDQRNTRAELVAWMDKYFKVFPMGVCNTVSSCNRLEDGGGPIRCDLQASCQTAAPSGTPKLKSHIIFGDVETGIGVGFDLFMNNTDMHMFKMYGGKVYAVHAILGKATTTGWE